MSAQMPRAGKKTQVTPPPRITLKDIMAIGEQEGWCIVRRDSTSVSCMFDGASVFIALRANGQVLTVSVHGGWTLSKSTDPEAALGYLSDLNRERYIGMVQHDRESGRLWVFHAELLADTTLTRSKLAWTVETCLLSAKRAFADQWRQPK